MRTARCYPLRSVSARVSFAVTMAAVTAPGIYAQDLDRVLLRNGNPIVGEIEELRRGTLRFDTEEMNIVGIDWNDIALLTSSRIFEVTDLDGFQYSGRLGPTDQQGTLVVALGAIADTLAFSEIVEITYIGQGFLTKTSGFVDLGANLTQANNLASLLLKTRFVFRGRLWEVDWNGETYFQRQETTTDVGEVFEEQTSRNSTGVTVRRFFGGSWAATTWTNIEQNEELSLDSRILIIAGVSTTSSGTRAWSCPPASAAR